MQELRFHGRGGQGAVTSAELLAQAAISDDKYARAFPSFGPERRGAPVVAYCRISDNPINLRSVIERPDIVVVLDSSLFKVVDVTAGLKDDGILLVNSSYEPQHFAAGERKKVATLDATRIALEILKQPITNTLMLGLLLRVTGLVSMEALQAALKMRFNEKIYARNVQALERAFAQAQIHPAWQEQTSATAEQ